MTLTSLLRMALVALGVAAVVLLGGCRLPTFFRRPPAPARPTARPAPMPAQRLEQEAVEAVTRYVTALNEHNYADAYAMLSKNSRARHSRAGFEQQGKQGMPLYDLGTAKATVTGDRALVVVQQYEDPATHGFSLVRVGEVWKVVYQGGMPGSPGAD